MLNRNTSSFPKEGMTSVHYVSVEPGCQVEFSCKASSHEDLAGVSGYSADYLTLNTFHLVLDFVMHPRIGRIFLKVLDAGTEKVRYTPASNLQLARYVLDKAGKLHGPDGQSLTLWPFISAEILEALEDKKLGAGL